MRARLALPIALLLAATAACGGGGKSVSAWVTAVCGSGIDMADNAAPHIEELSGLESGDPALLADPAALIAKVKAGLKGVRDAMATFAGDFGDAGSPDIDGGKEYAEKAKKELDDAMAKIDEVIAKLDELPDDATLADLMALGEQMSGLEAAFDAFDETSLEEGAPADVKKEFDDNETCKEADKKWKEIGS